MPPILGRFTVECTSVWNCLMLLLKSVSRVLHTARGNHGNLNVLALCSLLPCKVAPCPSPSTLLVFLAITFICLFYLLMCVFVGEQRGAWPACVGQRTTFGGWCSPSTCVGSGALVASGLICWTISLAPYRVILLEVTMYRAPGRYGPPSGGCSNRKSVLAFCVAFGVVRVESDVFWCSWLLPSPTSLDWMKVFVIQANRMIWRIC